MRVGNLEAITSPSPQQPATKYEHAEDVVRKTAADAEFAALAGDKDRADRLRLQADTLGRNAAFLALRKGLEIAQRR